MVRLTFVCVQNVIVLCFVRNFIFSFEFTM